MRLGTKAELRERFGVAVATVNEAVRMLEMRGLIDARPGPGGGLFVRDRSPLVRLRHATLSVDEPRTELVRDCLRVRTAIEPMICSDAGKLCTTSDQQALDECLRRMNSATDPREYMKANWDLHRTIAALPPTWFYASSISGCSTPVEDALEDVELDDEVLQQQNLDHRELVDAIDRAIKSGYRPQSHDTTRSTWT
jgi:DNA-binding FadR family transcriptional regulator